MNRNLYLKALRQHVFPLLREAGFKGSGTTFRRISGCVVHVFNVQGSTGQDGCYINPGAHLLLPKFGDEVHDPAKLSEAGCFFRQRFEPDQIKGEIHGRWPYGNTEYEMESSAKQIRDKWEQDGNLFFKKYTEYPADFLTVIRNVDHKSMHPGTLAEHAELAIALGIYDRSKIFVQEALERCPEKATGLKSKLVLLLKNIQDLSSD